jgi:phage terminase large subunit GpA-like protein
VRDGATVYLEAFADNLEPPPTLTVSEWADARRVLSGKAASEPGPWRTARTPYLREILDGLSRESDAHEIVFWAATQLGKSEACNNWLGYIIDHHPGPVMMVQPTLDLAKRYSKQRISSLIETTPSLAAKVQPSRARDSGNTLTTKEFPGGILIIAGANSASGLRSMPARDLLFDEIDAYPFDLNGEGNPIEIAQKRQDTYKAVGKILKTSTCTVKGESRIEQAYALSDRRRYFVPCPDCGAMQILAWKNLRWPEGRPELAAYACESCGTLIDERHKPAMLAGGEWRAEEPAARVRGYWLNSLYSPLGWLPWADIAREFLAAKVALDTGDTTLMQVFVNTRLAETWELRGASFDDDAIRARAENYQLRTIPRGALILTAAVDCQHDRLELQIQAWGAGAECWIIDYQQLYGDPADAAIWQRLDEILKTPIRNAYGLDLTIKQTAVDHGGHHSLQVEAFTRGRPSVIAIKGQSQPNKPLIGRPKEYEATWRGKKLRAGASIYPVGSDTGKHALFDRLRVTEPGPGYIHTSRELPPEWFKGLTAEQYITRPVGGRMRGEWILKKGRRNEPLDLFVYNLAAAANLGLFRRRPAEWERLAAQLEPPLFAPQDPPADQAPSSSSSSPAAELEPTPPPPPAPRPRANPPPRRRAIGRIL